MVKSSAHVFPLLLQGKSRQKARFYEAVEHGISIILVEATKW